MVKSDPTKNDLALGLNGMVLAVRDQGPEHTRKAQMNVAAVCDELWPGDEQALREALGELGLWIRTGLETYGPDGQPLKENTRIETPAPEALSSSSAP